jgi:hypothetical protein
MAPAGKALRVKAKPEKAKGGGKTSGAKAKGDAPGPDERRPQVKADEIYGDTKIPQRGGKA